LNEFFQSDGIRGAPFRLVDYKGVGALNCPLSGCQSVFWVAALHRAVTDPAEFSGSLVDMWNSFGELLMVAHHPVHGPVYISKRSATKEHVAAAVALVRNDGGTVH
jgi:hypothetical protein